MIAFSSISEQGSRASNQDRVLLPRLASNGKFVAAIADGVGGAHGGDVAAQIAVDFLNDHAGTGESFERLFALIVDELRSEARKNTALDRMSTTLSAVSYSDAKIQVAHVGDCRIYHIRGSGLNTLTRDQTEVAELLRRGVISKSQARRYPRKNVLFSSLSARGDFELFEATAEIARGDRIILLTDGAYRKISKKDMVQASLRCEAIKEFICDLKIRINAEGPEDNFSILAIQF